MAASGDRSDNSPVANAARLPRVIALESSSNCRDVGGWPLSVGQVREGVAFRSSALDRLTDADQTKLTDLGLRTICDFRGVAEAAASPSRLDKLPNIQRFALPIEPSVGASLRDIAKTRDATGEDVASLMRRAYTAYALECGHRFRTLFDLLLEDGRTPLLFHCSAGKDRTGFATALLLTAIGVAWDQVMQDYLATNEIWKGDERLAAELPQAAAQELLRVSPSYLESGFAALQREYGSIDRYLERVLGLAPKRRDRLIALFLN
jgi:protein-tyrosine phosphatase